MRVLLFLTVFCGAVMAQEALPSFERLVVKGKAYQSVKVVAVEPSGIRFMHATGAGRAKFEELDPEVRSKFKFDPAEAARFEMNRQSEQMVAAQERRIAKLKEELADQAKKSAVWVSGKVWRVTEKGVELEQAFLEDGEGKRHGLPNDQVFLICETRGVVDGHWVEQIAYPRGSYSVGGSKMKCYTVSLQGYLEYLEDPTAAPK